MPIDERELEKDSRLERSVTEGRRPERLEQLDSLRGLAAFSVVMCHYLLVYPLVWRWYSGLPAGKIMRYLSFPPLYPLWDGHAAVVLFFILSGFVLALPVLQNRQPVYRHYLLKRVLRIYVPYAAAMVAAIPGAFFLSRGHIPELSQWFQYSWTTPVTLKIIKHHAILIRSFDTSPYNNPIWSLVHEMRISIVFPLLALWVARQRWFISVAGVLVLFVGGWIISQKTTGFSNAEAWDSIGTTVHYASLFILGAILAKYRRMFSARIEVMPRWGVVSLTIVFLLLYSWDRYTPHARMGTLLHLYELPSAVGAGALIILAASSSWLLAPGLIWLGRISYSLYLWHLPVMLAIVHVGFGHAPVGLLLAVSVLSSLIVATLMHSLVEVPAISLGRRLCAKDW